MPLNFPEPEETMRCPYCEENTGFSLGGQHRQQGIVISMEHKGPKSPASHYIEARFCRTCGGPVIRHRVSVAAMGGRSTKIDQEHVYPKAPTRGMTPDEVRDDDPELAEDYDEAVTCEPHSLQAAVMLLGRCMERILCEKCGATSGETLGPMIKEVIEKDTVPTYLHDGLQNGFLACRNQGSHQWTTAAGKLLKVDAESVDGSFAVVGALFDQCYTGPKRRSRFVRRMKNVETQKARP